MTDERRTAKSFGGCDHDVIAATSAVDWTVGVLSGTRLKDSQQSPLRQSFGNVGGTYITLKED
jgi:hypothetical protein